MPTTHTEPKKLSRVQAMTTKGKTLIAKGKAVKPAAPKPLVTAPIKTSTKANSKTAEPQDDGAIAAMTQARRKLTMSSDARACIKAGMTRVDLRQHLLTEWQLPKEKVWYANWYFADAKRKGIKTCECK